MNFNAHYIKDWINYRTTVGISKDPSFDENWSFQLPELLGSNVYLGGCANGKILSFWKNMEMNNDVLVNLTGSGSTVGVSVGSKWQEGGPSIESVKGSWRNETEAGAFAHNVTWNKGEKNSVESDIGARFDMENHSWLFRL